MFEPTTENVVVVSAVFMDKPSGKRAYARVTNIENGDTADVTLTPNGKPIGVGSRILVRWLAATPGHVCGEVL